MNISRINKLINLLESGELPQSRGQLRKSNGYCCLGVACELYSVEHGGYWDNYTFISGVNSRGEEISLHLSLDSTILNWYGLPPSANYVLINLNDIKLFSFKEIASYLRRQAQRYKNKMGVVWNVSDASKFIENE